MNYKDRPDQPAYQKDWYIKNKDSKLASVKEYREQNKDKITETYLKWKQSPKGRYSDHKKRARSRGIPFLLTFSEWWNIWESSGKWEERGTHGYVMCRTGDLGAYEVGNVRVDTFLNNIKESHGTGGKARSLSKVP